jgi:DNA-binding IclR family transcriptional regulator
LTEQETKLQKYSAPALEKGLDILEVLSLSNTELSLSQIAAAIDRSKSEIFRMMIVLEERGYIARNSSDCYRLTERLAVLSAQRPVNQRLAECAAVILTELAAQTKLSCYLSALDDGELQVIAEARSAVGYGISVDVGYRSPLLGSAAGLSILAFMRDDELQMRLDGGFAADATGQKSTIVRALQACRQKLVISFPSAALARIDEIATPIVSLSTSRPIAALAIPYWGGGGSTDQVDGIIDRLLSAGQRLREKIALVLPQL